MSSHQEGGDAVLPSSSKPRKRSKDGITIEIEDGGVMTQEDFDDLMNIMASIIIRKYEQSLLTDTPPVTTLIEQLELNFE